MQVQAVLSSRSAQEAVERIADATGLTDDEVRAHLPQFLADGIEVELDALRRVEHRQVEFVHYVRSKRQTAPVEGAVG